MLTSQRKKHLLDLLALDGRIVAKTLSEQLGLSEDTIRRDLRELAKEGLLQRVHGGALPASPAMAVFAERENISADAKSAIGRTAAGLVQPGQVVFVDGGTTAVQLVRHLPADLRATVVTHSPSIAVELLNHPHIEVIMIGGRLFKHSIVALGAAAIEAIGRIRADLYFMGVCSLHPEAGIGTGDFEESCVKRALCDAAAETIVLASPEKLDTASPFQIVPLSRISRIVVDSTVPEHLIAPYSALGISISLAFETHK
ncbi:DeoR/GlpR family DNA-binding transcription regulator [Paraherbaspirillum soli]|uniref:DeoR/GlpR family DNA-binding transcription regulator n=1 Tax=Paraherbaspirillum soli TaxID=631222 RepID=A0ABW0M8V4_9BURK